MTVPQPPEPHFSVDELVHVCCTDGRIGPETEARAIHHFALLCPECQAALDQLPTLEDCYPGSVTGLALIRLARPPAAHLELRPNHRAAIAAARSQPLGFCHLLAEEAWWADKYHKTSGRVSLLLQSYGLILSNGACLFAPREAHDLQAHLLTFFAQAYSAYAGDPARAAEAAELARFHLRRGKGNPEPEATLLEVEAEVEFWNAKPGSGRVLLEKARQALVGYEPADREAEVLLGQAIFLPMCGEASWPEVAAACRKGLAILDQLAPGTNPPLRLDLTHELAVAEANRFFYQRLLGEDDEGPDPAAIEQMVADQEPLYRQHAGSIRDAERAALLGKILVFSDPERAQAAFRQALGHYCRQTEERPAAAKLLRELVLLWGRAAACGAPGVDLSFLVGLWDLPEDEWYFCELMAEVEAAFASEPCGVALADELRQLRQAVRARSQEAGPTGGGR